MTEEEKSDYISKKLKKANSLLDQINNLIQFEYFDTSINRIYYASFYAVQALLAKQDLFPKTHKGTLNLFALHFINEKKIPSELESYFPRIMDQRFLADYGADDFADKEVVNDLLLKATDFIRHIENLLNEK